MGAARGGDFFVGALSRKKILPVPIDSAETGRKIIVAGVVHAVCEQHLNYPLLRFFAAKKIEPLTR
jgi:hypothetical protein